MCQVLQPPWLCHLLNLLVSSASQKYSGYFASLHFSVNYFFPSFILTCCWKCNCYSHLIAPSLDLGPFLMLLLLFSLLPLFSKFPLFLVISLRVCAGFFVSSWKYPHLLFYSLKPFPKGRAASSWLRQLFHPLPTPHGTTHFLHLYMAMTLHPQCLSHCQ